MKLLESETIITQSAGSSSERIYLTNFRIVQEKDSGASSKVVSINLPSVTSCELKSKSRPIWFLVGILIGVSIIALTNEMIFGVGGMAIGILGFLFSRTSIIYIASPTSTISFNVAGLTKEACRKFLDQVEEARHKSM